VHTRPALQAIAALQDQAQLEKELRGELSGLREAAEQWAAERARADDMALQLQALQQQVAELAHIDALRERADAAAAAERARADALAAQLRAAQQAAAQADAAARAEAEELRGQVRGSGLGGCSSC
jgi:hypothetical protein